MNKEESVTHYINAMFDKDNVQMAIPDCVQNDCYMEGVVDSKVVIYYIRNCSRNLLHQAKTCLYYNHGATCVIHFDPYSNSGTIIALIKKE